VVVAFAINMAVAVNTNKVSVCPTIVVAAGTARERIPRVFPQSPGGIGVSFALRAWGSRECPRSKC
jgi:hypothetical protein